MLDSRGVLSPSRTIAVALAAACVVACATGGDPGSFGDDTPSVQTRPAAPDAASPPTHPSSSSTADSCEPEVDGDTAPLRDLDTAPIDASPDPDGDGASASLPPAPSPGDLLVTEVMFEPDGPEPDSEWFEVYDTTAEPRLLSGLTILDGYGDAHVIASAPPVVAPPGAYVLLVRDAAAARAALVPAAPIVYEYGAGLPPDQGIELDDGPLSDLSLWDGSTELADVPYGQWDAAAPGQSIELASYATSQSDPAQWCFAEAPWASGSDYGTPGSPSDCL